MRNFVIAATWSATLAIAFVVGQAVSTDDAPTVAPTLPGETAKVGAVAAKSSAAGAGEAVAPPPAPGAAMADIGSQPKPVAVPAELVRQARPMSFSERLEAVLADGHPISRAAGLTELLTELTPGSAVLIYERLMAQPATRERERELQLLAFAWGEVGGAQAATRLLEENGQGDPRRGWSRNDGLIGAALAGWATADAEAAEAWARAQTDDEDNPYLVGVVRGLSLQDPDAASKLLYEMPYGRNRGHGAGYLVEAYLKEGVGSAQARIETLPQDRLKDGIVRMAVGRMASEDPAATAAWITNLTDVDADYPTRVVGAVWAREDPDAALAWVDGLSSEEMQANGAEALVRHWPSSRMAELESWLLDMDSAVARDEALSQLVRRDGYREEGEVKEKWLAMISDPKKREEAREDSNRRTRGRGRGN